MLPNAIESFTALDAVAAGLAEAVCEGTVKIIGTYEVTEHGLKFDQRVFSFADNYGDLRFGRFTSDAELYNFASEFGELSDENPD